MRLCGGWHPLPPTRSASLLAPRLRVGHAVPSRLAVVGLPLAILVVGLPCAIHVVGLRVAVLVVVPVTVFVFAPVDELVHPRAADVGIIPRQQGQPLRCLSFRRRPRPRSRWRRRRRLSSAPPGWPRPPPSRSVGRCPPSSPWASARLLRHRCSQRGGDSLGSPFLRRSTTSSRSTGRGGRGRRFRHPQALACRGRGFSAS